MAKFVQFTESATDAPVAVNPDHVARVLPAPEDPAGVTLIYLRDGGDFRVRGAFTEVVRRLTVPSVT
jgi:hypothetical protein